MNQEQEVLNAFERGKAFGFAEGMKSMRLKELTDEEIEELIWNTTDMKDFARAILRKAQSNCNGFCGEYECKENKEGCKRNERP